MKELRGFLLLLLAVMLVAGLISGDIDRLAQTVTAYVTRLTEIIRLLAAAVALLLLVIGAIVYASPFHRQLGARLMAGALTMLTVAALAPHVLHWLDAQLTAWGGRLLGGQP